MYTKYAISHFYHQFIFRNKRHGNTYNNGYENNIDLKKNHCHLKVAQQKNGFEKAGGTSNPLKMNKNNLGHSKTIESSTSSCNK